MLDEREVHWTWTGLGYAALIQWVCSQRGPQCWHFWAGPPLLALPPCQGLGASALPWRISSVAACFLGSGGLFHISFCSLPACVTVGLGNDRLRALSRRGWGSATYTLRSLEQAGSFTLRTTTAGGSLWGLQRALSLGKGNEDRALLFPGFFPRFAQQGHLLPIYLVPCLYCNANSYLSSARHKRCIRAPRNKVKCWGCLQA